MKIMTATSVVRSFVFNLIISPSPVDTTIHSKKVLHLDTASKHSLDSIFIPK